MSRLSNVQIIMAGDPARALLIEDCDSDEQARNNERLLPHIKSTRKRSVHIDKCGFFVDLFVDRIVDFRCT